MKNLKSKKFLIVGIILFVTIICCVAIGLSYHNKLLDQTLSTEGEVLEDTALTEDSNTTEADEEVIQAEIEESIKNFTIDTVKLGVEVIPEAAIVEVAEDEDLDEDTTEAASDAENTDSANDAEEESVTASHDPIIICIDPGHGGWGDKNTGCHFDYDGVTIYEKDINLKIATKLKAYLEQYDGITVVMTRTTDTAMSLEERVNIGINNNADYFISIHNNSSSTGDPNHNGCLVICTVSNYNNCYAASTSIASNVLANLNAIGIPYTNDFNANLNGGLLQRPSESGATYPDGSVSDYYGIISRCTKAAIPSVIIEHAFLSNSSDYYNHLSTDAELDELARADCAGIISAIY